MVVVSIRLFFARVAARVVTPRAWAAAAAATGAVTVRGARRAAPAGEHEEARKLSELGGDDIDPCIKSGCRVLPEAHNARPALPLGQRSRGCRREYL